MKRYWYEKEYPKGSLGDYLQEIAHWFGEVVYYLPGDPASFLMMEGPFVSLSWRDTPDPSSNIVDYPAVFKAWDRFEDAASALKYSMEHDAPGSREDASAHLRMSKAYTMLKNEINDVLLISERA